jgi:hypothetical protein
MLWGDVFRSARLHSVFYSPYRAYTAIQTLFVLFLALRCCILPFSAHVFLTAVKPLCMPCCVLCLIFLLCFDQ